MSTSTLAATLVALALCLLAPHARAQDEEYDEDDVVVEVVSVPATAAGKQLDWVLRVVNGKAKVGDPTEHFSDRFLEDFKPGELEGELAKIKPEGFAGNDAEPVSIDQNESEESITATIRGKGTKRYLSVFIALDAQNMKIASLLFNIAAGSGGDATWDAYDGEMGQMKGTASFGAYEIVARPAFDGALPYRLVPVHEFGEEKVLPIGSAFKLWVLGALAEEIEAGRASWTERLPIYDSLRSLPSGRMQNLPGGSRPTLATYAEEMISISDNTATDHLIARIGRERVEGFMARVTDRPGLNQPLLSTRELFALKIGNAPWLMDEFVESDEDARREFVRPGGRLFRTQVEPFSALLWKKPIAVTKVEWFASCHDLCRAMAMLRHIEQRPGMERVGSILRKNPGIPYDPKVWKSVGFKGGSEPGVMTLTLLLERTDGRWFVLSAGWTNETELLEEQRLVEMVTKGMEMLADLE